MGHFFIYRGSDYFSGVNFKGKFLVARRDLFDKKIEDARNLASDKGVSNTVELMSNIAKIMQYPSSYITESFAKNKHSYAYGNEKEVYDIFSNTVTKEILNFDSRTISGFKINLNDISSLIEIFLTNNEIFDFEIIPNTTIIKISKKQSIVNKFFLGGNSGASTFGFDVKNLKYIECSPEEIRFFDKASLIYILRRN